MLAFETIPYILQVCYVQSSCLDNNMKCQNALWAIIQGHADQHYCCLMSSWCYFRYFLAGHFCIHTHISKLTCAISQTWRDCSCGWTRITYKERSKALKKTLQHVEFVCTFQWHHLQMPLHICAKPHKKLGRKRHFCCHPMQDLLCPEPRLSDWRKQKKL